MKILRDVNCIVCGKKFTPRIEWQKFCSVSHRSIWTASIREIAQEYVLTKEGRARLLELVADNLKVWEERKKERKEELDEKD